MNTLWPSTLAVSAHGLFKRAVNMRGACAPCDAGVHDFDALLKLRGAPAAGYDKAL